MSHCFLYRVLYAVDQPAPDTAVLTKMRLGWAKMVASPWQTTWEDFAGGSNIHIYGIVPHTSSALTSWACGWMAR